MAAISSEVVVQTSESPRLRVLSRTRELVEVRQLLGRLVRKEVAVKYKSSVLGVAWSMLNPVLYLAIFSLIFSVVLRNNIQHFAVYLLSGLLAWNFFSTTLGLASRSVVDNANLVTKVYFPREILPLASEGAALVDFGLQALVLALFMLAFRVFHPGLNLLLLPLALLVLLLFSSALALVVAALNVRYRDTQHLLNLLLLMWFWGTPVVYASGRVYDSHTSFLGVSLFHLFLVNPVGDVVLGFQRALYGVIGPASPNNVLPDVSVGYLAGILAVAGMVSLVLLYLAWRMFFRLSGDFAEEL